MLAITTLALEGLPNVQRCGQEARVPLRTPERWQINSPGWNRSPRVFFPLSASGCPGQKRTQRGEGGSRGRGPVTNGLKNLNYPGDHGSARTNFPIDTWIELQKHLVTTEVVMRTIAAEKQWQFLSNTHGDWPARRLRMKKAFGYSEVGVSLNPNYAQDPQVVYLLTRRDVRSFLGLFERLVHYREIARYSASEIDDREVLFRILRTALSP